MTNKVLLDLNLKTDQITKISNENLTIFQKRRGHRREVQEQWTSQISGIQLEIEVASRYDGYDPLFF